MLQPMQLFKANEKSQRVPQSESVFLLLAFGAKLRFAGPVSVAASWSAGRLVPLELPSAPVPSVAAGASSTAALAGSCRTYIQVSALLHPAVACDLGRHSQCALLLRAT